MCPNSGFREYAASLRARRGLMEDVYQRSARYRFVLKGNLAERVFKFQNFFPKRSMQQLGIFQRLAN